MSTSFLVSFLLPYIFWTVRAVWLIVRIIYRGTSAEHAERISAATKHSAESACEPPRHLPGHSAEETSLIHLGHHLLHLLILTQDLVDLTDG